MKMRWEYIAEICNFEGYRKGAELGVKEGRFSRYILEHVPDSRMICVDTWSPVANSIEDYSDWDFKSIETLFDFAIQPYKDRSLVLKMTTDEAVNSVQDGLLDFVFIDADHSYEGVKNDIDKWTPKVRKGGMICGHDIDLESVSRAVAESFKYEIGSNKVWVTWR